MFSYKLKSAFLALWRLAASEFCSVAIFQVCSKIDSRTISTNLAGSDTGDRTSAKVGWWCSLDIRSSTNSIIWDEGKERMDGPTGVLPPNYAPCLFRTGARTFLQNWRELPRQQRSRPRADTERALGKVKEDFIIVNTIKCKDLHLKLMFWYWWKKAMYSMKGCNFD